MSGIVLQPGTGHASIRWGAMAKLEEKTYIFALFCYVWMNMKSMNYKELFIQYD